MNQNQPAPTWFEELPEAIIESNPAEADDVVAQLDGCNCCGGLIPQEGSPSWKDSNGTCPGSVVTTWNWGLPVEMCGAFRPDLSTEAS